MEISSLRKLDPIMKKLSTAGVSSTPPLVTLVAVEQLRRGEEVEIAASFTLYDGAVTTWETLALTETAILRVDARKTEANWSFKSLDDPIDADDVAGWRTPYDTVERLVLTDLRLRKDQFMSVYVRDSYDLVTATGERLRLGPDAAVSEQTYQQWEELITKVRNRIP